MTELNGRNFKLANVTANTFELTGLGGTDIDGSGFSAYTSGGTSAKVYEVATPYAAADLDILKFVQSNDVMTIVHPTYAPRDLGRTGHAAWTLTQIAFVPNIGTPTNVDVAELGQGGSEPYSYKVTALADETLEESLIGTGTAAAITGATSADPVVLTVTAHPFANGSKITISDVGGMTELNGNTYTVAGKTTNTVQLENVDGTGFTAYTSGGSAQEQAGVTIDNGNSTLSDSNFNQITWDAVTDAERYRVYKLDNGIFGYIGETETTTFDDKNIIADLADTPPDAKNPFDGAGNFPGCVTYHEERRAYGRTDNRTHTVFMSRTAAYANMNTSIPLKNDDALTYTIVARQVNEIRHLVSLGDLIVLTSGAEWIVKPGGSADVLTPDLVVKAQSYRGTSHLPPIVAGEVVLFVQEKGQVIRDLGYRFDVDAYTGEDITLLARHLFENNTIREWTFAQSPHSQIWTVMEDGALRALTYFREQGQNSVWAWSRHDTVNGAFESTASVSEGNADATYFIVRRRIGGRVVRYIERLADRDFGDDVKDAYFVDCGLSLDAPIAVSGITSANPAVVTTAADHGLTTGDLVDMEGTKTLDAKGYPVDHATAGRRYQAAVLTATTFELRDYLDATGIDGSAWTAWHEGGNVREAFTNVSGLWHLEGETVSILANGDVKPQATVSGGALTLDRAASRIHAGFAIEADFETLAIAGEVGEASLQGRRMTVPKLTVRLERTRGGFFGPSLDDLTHGEFKPDIPELNTPGAMITGDRQIQMTGAWDRAGSIAVRQSDPLPMTILGVIPEIAIGGH